ncbi:MAG: hypothetical protein ACPH3M_08280 [Candidatus Puniceispirillales bacterium]
MKKVECIVPNCWTSAGKSLKGDEIELPEEEAKQLVADKLFKASAGRPKKAKS